MRDDDWPSCELEWDILWLINGPSNIKEKPNWLIEKGTSHFSIWVYVVELSCERAVTCNTKIITAKAKFMVFFVCVCVGTWLHEEYKSSRSKCAGERYEMSKETKKCGRQTDDDQRYSSIYLFFFFYNLEKTCREWSKRVSREQTRRRKMFVVLVTFK